jgi:hypothetical protein
MDRSQGWKAKTIFLGWSAGRSNPKPWLRFAVPHLMINAYDFKIRRRRCDPFSRHYSYQGEVFCDSGGYQLLRSGIQIAASDIIRVQEKLRACLNAALDHPLDASQHLKYFEAYVAHRHTHPRFAFVPVIPHDLPKRTIERMAKLYPDPAMIAIGKVVPALFPLRDAQALRKVIENIFHIRACFPRSRVHIFGAGGITSTALLLLVADSVDSSSWLHDARYGKIRRAGGGFVDVHREDSVKRFLSEGSDCGCPICQSNHRRHFGPHRLHAFQARAVHNAWTLLREVEALNRCSELGEYVDALERRMRKSPWHATLFGAIDQILKRRSELVSNSF